MKKNINLLMGIMLSAALLCLTGCGNDNNNTSTSQNTAAQTNTEADGTEDTAAVTTAEADNTNTAADTDGNESVSLQADTMTIDLAIAESLRFDADAGIAVYAAWDDTLYLTYNEADKWIAALRNRELSIDTQVSQVDLSDEKGIFFLTDTGKLWYSRYESCFLFPGETIVQFSESIGTNGSYGNQYYIAGVTEDGRVLYVSSNEMGDVKEVPGWDNAKYVGVTDGKQILVVNQDGTAAKFTDEGFRYDWSDCDLSSWTDIEWISGAAGYIIGLKSDGTVIGTGDYPEGILTWTDMVYICANFDSVWGIRSDGGRVYTDFEGNNLEWENTKIRVQDAAMYGAIAFDGSLSGSARYMYYRWSPELIDESIDLYGEDFSSWDLTDKMKSYSSLPEDYTIDMDGLEQLPDDVWPVSADMLNSESDI